MIAYTPPGYGHRADSAGKIQVGPWPDQTGWSDGFSNTVGGCFAHNGLSPAQVAARVFVDFAIIVTRDGIDPQQAHQAFLAIDEYRRMIPTDMPGGEASNPGARYSNDTPTSKLPLPARAMNALLDPREEGQYDTVGKIRNAKQSDLLRLPNMGPKSLKAVLDVVEMPTAS